MNEQANATGIAGELREIADDMASLLREEGWYDSLRDTRIFRIKERDVTRWRDALRAIADRLAATQPAADNDREGDTNG